MGNPSNITDRIVKFLEYQSEVYAPINQLPEISKPHKEQKPTEVIAENKAIVMNDNQNPTLENCNNLEELKLVCAGAKELRTDLGNTNLVFGVGNPRADLMLIGEAPGENEDREMEPFVGRAGQLLDKIIEAIAFKRDDIYIANILKHRPPDNRNPTEEERRRSLPYLEKQIELINPKLILCLGLVSAHTLLNTSLAMKVLRGKFHSYKSKYELMVTYHPAALLRNPAWKRSTWEDVQKLRNRYNELNCKP